MKHTPGPWQAIQQCANSISVLDKGGHEICSILSPEDDYVTQQCIDNAKLISCAPDLFEALLQQIASRSKTGIIKQIAKKVIEKAKEI